MGRWFWAVLTGFTLSCALITPAAAEPPAPVADPDPAPTGTAAPDVTPSAPITATVTVSTGGGTLNERAGPTTADAVAGHLADGATAGVRCQAWGEQVTGRVATSAWWEAVGDGRYVSDAYLVWTPTRPAVPWCGAGTSRAVTAAVHTSGGTLTVRAGPHTGQPRVGELADGTAVTVTCQNWGTTVTGTAGRTAAWDRLGTGRWISDAYVRWTAPPSMPWCTETPATPEPASTTAFVAASVAAARASMATYKVPASVTIAQAILESGGGASTLTRLDHNVFGMKCFGDPGPVAIGCRGYATHECDPRGCYATRDEFRVYSTQAVSYADHGILLSTSSRYRTAMRYTKDPDRFALELQRAGYATSSSYAADLVSLMKRYNLYRYDAPPSP